MYLLLKYHCRNHFSTYSQPFILTYRRLPYLMVTPPNLKKPIRENYPCQKGNTWFRKGIQYNPLTHNTLLFNAARADLITPTLELLAKV